MPSPLDSTIPHPPSGPIQSLALDLDGTLLNSSHQISPKNAEAVRLAHQAGVHIILSSGRMTPTILPYFEFLGIPGTLISYNGARLSTFTPGKPPQVLVSHQLPSSVCTDIFELCRQWNLLLNIYTDDSLWAYQPQGDFSLARFYTEQTGAVYQGKTQDPLLFSSSEVIKMLAICPIEERDFYFNNFSNHLGVSCQIIKSQPQYVEFTLLGVTKALALETYFKNAQISADQCMAMGDAENDLEMLQWAGWGIAVANASQGLKEKFNRHSPYNHDQDAVARAIYQYILMSPFNPD